jgi:hypothetical protein
MAKKPAKSAAKSVSKAEPKAKAKAPTKVEKVAKPKKAAAIPVAEEATDLNVALGEPAAEKPAKAAKVKAEKAPKVKKPRAKPVLDVSAGSDHHNKWLELKEKHSKDKATPYAMSATFEAHQPIQHKSLGWGLILSNNNDRLEVLFETGVKILISNYKQ